MTPDEPRDPPLSWARLSRGPIALTDEGEGPPLILLHGIPGSVRDFRWLGVGLGGLRTIRLDAPGFGSTPASSGAGVRLCERAETVLESADVLGLDRFALLAHSMAGPLAMEVARQAPLRVTHLVLLASVGLRPHRLWRRLGRRPELNALLDWPGLGPILRSLARRMLVRGGFPSSTSSDVAAQTLKLVGQVRFEEIRAAARGVRCPTMIAWAEDDAWVESSIALELSTLLPAGPRIAFPDGGHNLQKTRAVELAEAILSFVSPTR